MKFFIRTFGCQMNVNDSEKMKSILDAEGYESADQVEDADIVIINSCAVREKAQEKIFSYIGKLNEKQKAVVCGCVAQSEKENLLKRNRKISYVLGTHQYYRIADVCHMIYEEGFCRGVMADFRRDWLNVVPGLKSRENNITAFISIMEGCNNFCTYCIVPFTRSREKSRDFESVVREAEELGRIGYKEIILLGQNVNSWKDSSGTRKFADLLRAVAERSGVKWIRFITSYPGYHNDAIIDVMKEHRNIVRHIHFPAQSGSTDILRKMNRVYSREEYLDIIERFKKEIPEIRFSSDFIVGFPSETEEDFKQTLSLLEIVQYDSLFSFVYSPRKYTKAEKMEDNVSAQEKKERLYKLQELQKNIQLKNNKAMIGREFEVLIAGVHPRKKGEVLARTESYRVVHLETEREPGEFVKVRITGAGPHSLKGVVL